jgi:hypothetical protein
MIGGMEKDRRQNIVETPSGAVLGPLMAEIRFLASVSEKVFFSPHAQTQMATRAITDVEAIRVLKLGEISGVPWFEPDIGGRGCKVVFRPQGGRRIGVVTVVLEDGELLVKTVEWEDER